LYFCRYNLLFPKNTRARHGVFPESLCDTGIGHRTGQDPPECGGQKARENCLRRSLKKEEAGTNPLRLFLSKFMKSEKMQWSEESLLIYLIKLLGDHG
jgi:hypothetical protein